MKTVIYFAVFLGLLALIGAMAYYHLVLIPEMRQSPQETNPSPSWNVQLPE